MLLAAWLMGIALVVIGYLWRFVTPYASLDPSYYDYLWPWRYALWAHLAGGLMIRSYVVASAFVFFRLFVDALHAFGVHGSKGVQTPEELKLAAWFCWSIPLLVTEVLIQSRHLRRADFRSSASH